MKAILRRTWIMFDGSKKYREVTLGSGEFELERIPCPTGHDCNWLVVKGTLIGASENFWRDNPPEIDEESGKKIVDDFTLEIFDDD